MSLLKAGAPVRGRAERTKKFKVPSPAGDRDIFATAHVIKSSEINDQTKKSPYNTRSAEHLSLASVLDIFPEIKSAKKNSVPAIGYKDGDIIYILAGMRRSYCVSMLKDGEFHIHLYEGLTEEEKKKLAKRSDEYSKPTKVDLGFSLIAYRKASEDKVTLDDISEAFEISTGQASEVMNFTKLPDSLFDLFPSLTCISYTFLRDAIKAKKEDEDKLLKAISTVSKFDVDSDDTLETVRTKAVKLESEILGLLQGKKAKRKQPPKPSMWDDLKEVKGIKATKAANGSLALKFTSKSLTEEKEKLLLDFIKELQK